MLGCLLRNPEKSVDKFLKSRLEKSVDLRSLLTEVCWLEKSIDRSLLTWEVCWQKSVDFLKQVSSQQSTDLRRLEKSVDLRSLLTWEVNRLEKSTDLDLRSLLTWEVCWQVSSQQSTDLRSLLTSFSKAETYQQTYQTPAPWLFCMIDSVRGWSWEILVWHWRESSDFEDFLFWEVRSQKTAQLLFNVVHLVVGVFLHKGAKLAGKMSFWKGTSQETLFLISENQHAECLTWDILPVV